MGALCLYDPSLLLCAYINTFDVYIFVGGDPNPPLTQVCALLVCMYLYLTLYLPLVVPFGCCWFAGTPYSYVIAFSYLYIHIYTHLIDIIVWVMSLIPLRHMCVLYWCVCTCI